MAALEPHGVGSGPKPCDGRAVNDMVPPVFGALLIAITAPALAYAFVTGRLWVGLFPLPETFSPERISRADNPRRYHRHLLGQCICLIAGVALVAL